MQIKTTMRYHHTAVRMPIINKTANNPCWWRCGERGTFLHCWWECRLVQSLWKAVWRYLKKLKMDLPFDPAIPLLGIHPKHPKIVWKNTWAPVFMAELFIIPKIWKQPISRWVDKKAVVHLHNGILFSYKKEESFTFCDSVDGPGKHYAKWNKSVREGQIPYNFTHMWNLINGLN